MVISAGLSVRKNLWNLMSWELWELGNHTEGGLVIDDVTFLRTGAIKSFTTLFNIWFLLVPLKGTSFVLLGETGGSVSALVQFFRHAFLILEIYHTQDMFHVLFLHLFVSLPFHTFRNRLFIRHLLLLYDMNLKLQHLCIGLIKLLKAIIMHKWTYEGV